MFDLFGRKRKLQILKISQSLVEVIGVATQNRIYISQLQKELEYLREFLNKNDLKIETRDEWFAKIAKEDEKKLVEKTENELAKMKAKTILENEGKPEKI